MKYVDTQRPLFSFLYAICCDSSTASAIGSNPQGAYELFKLPRSSRDLMDDIIAHAPDGRPNQEYIARMWPDLKKDLLVAPSSDARPEGWGPASPYPKCGVFSLLFALMSDPATARKLRAEPQPALEAYCIPQDETIRKILGELLHSPGRALTSAEADALRPRIEAEILNQSTAW